MNHTSRHILVLLQVIALVMFPQVAVVGDDVMPMLGMAASDASSHYHSNSHHHDKVVGDHSHGHEHAQKREMSDTHSATFSEQSSKGELTCHPCCVGGKGACIAVMATLPEVPLPPLTGSTDSKVINAFWSRSVPPPAHPPKTIS